MKEIVYYQKENWKIPVYEFLEKLSKNDPKLVSKILYKIDLLKIWKLWNEDIKFLKDKIYELRIKFSSNISRIFYFSIKNKKIVLLNAIVKKDNKINKKDIEKALKYKENYEKRIWKI